MTRLWTPEEKAELAALVAQGVTHAEIARRLGRSLSAVQKVACQDGVRSPNARERKNDEEVSCIRALAAEGKTTAEIATSLGMDFYAVKNFVRYYKIPVAKSQRFPEMTLEVKTRILALHAQKWSVRYIAKETGIGAERIRRFYRDQGIMEIYSVRKGKTVTARKWTPEEELLLLNLQETDSTAVIARRLKRTIKEVRGHAHLKGIGMMQGRLTLREFAEEIGIQSRTLSARMAKLGIPARRKKGNSLQTRGIMPSECVQVLTDLLENPGSAVYPQKKLRELRKYYQDLRDAGRVKDV